ncbi:hypothetical protein PAXRUDRAFT_690282 [Paxillus rubicundulus Ve08.2h10]|uniref:Uncharacterized protein n=1 Tax=Paxillus rubicundulus Ve08.2h10 TaxID=930991 RepID=A0A0D0DN23_9AGAM|nr:hypothetical protein PAXRUDRAFT_690282 [Paxillus rubicundulus Ve08.2h10]
MVERDLPDICTRPATSCGINCLVTNIFALRWASLVSRRPFSEPRLSVAHDYVCRNANRFKTCILLPL